MLLSTSLPSSGQELDSAAYFPSETENKWMSCDLGFYIIPFIFFKSNSQFLEVESMNSNLKKQCGFCFINLSHIVSLKKKNLNLSSWLCIVFGLAGPGSDPSPVLCPSGHFKRPIAPAQLQPADLWQTGAVLCRTERQMSLNVTQIPQQWSRDFFFPPAKGG